MDRSPPRDVRRQRHLDRAHPFARLFEGEQGRCGAPRTPIRYPDPALLRRSLDHTSYRRSRSTTSLRRLPSSELSSPQAR